MLDDLTGAWNRRYLFRRLNINKYRGGYLYFIDLDHFSDANKVLGHIEADQLLVDFVADIKSCLRDGVVIRYGGDEFVVISNTPLELKSSLSFTMGEVKVISDDLVKLLKFADHEMYRKKYSISE